MTLKQHCSDLGLLISLPGAEFAVGLDDLQGVSHSVPQFCGHFYKVRHTLGNIQVMGV